MKLNLQDVTNLQNEATAVSAINLNNTKLEAAIENTISRDGTSPNMMEGQLDMNDNRIINLPNAIDDKDPVTFAQVKNISKITGAAPAIALHDLVNPSDGMNLTGAWYRARSLNLLNLWLKKGNWTAEQLDMPDFTAAGNSWDETPGLELEGAGEQATVIRLISPAARYLMGQPSWKGTTFRGQVSHPKLRGLTLIGRGDKTTDQPLIALSNCARLLMENCEVAGNPAGALIDLHSFAAGGLWSAKLVNVRSLRARWEPTSAHAGVKLYSVATLLAERGRYAIRLRGPRDTIGKVNDVALYGCEFNDMLVGIIDTTGFGTIGTGFPYGGGCDNLYVDPSCFFAGQGARKIEEGEIQAITSNTRMTLRSDQFMQGTTGDYNNFQFVTTGTDGNFYAAYIDSFVCNGSVREVILDREIPAATVSGYYRIAYGDAQLRSDGFAPNTSPHAIFWEPNAYAARLGMRTEEIRSLVADPTANSKCVLVNPYRVVDSVDPMCFKDRTPFLPKVVAGSLNASGGGTAIANFAGQSFAYYDGENVPAGQAGPSNIRINRTGGLLVNGDVVCVKNTETGAVQAAVNYTNGTSGFYPHYVVWNGGGVTSNADEPVSIAMSGARVKVLVVNRTGSTINIAPNDLAMSQAPVDDSLFHGCAIYLARTSATVSDLAITLGTFESSYAIPAHSTMLCWIKAR